MNTLKLSGLCLTTILLAACNSGSNNGNQNGEVFNDLTTISNVPADGDPVEIFDPGSLEQDIVSLFGDADDEPLEVESGDSVQDIVDRGGRG